MADESTDGVIQEWFAILRPSLLNSCRQGEAAESLYIIISGRLRLLREDPAARLPVCVEEEVRNPPK